MRRINLMYLYPDEYTTNYYVEINEKVYSILKWKMRKTMIDYIDYYECESELFYELKMDEFEYLYRCLVELPLKQQNRIYEVYILHMKKIEVARIESCSESAIRQSIDRGLHQLYKKLVNRGIA